MSLVPTTSKAAKSANNNHDTTVAIPFDINRQFALFFSNMTLRQADLKTELDRFVFSYSQLARNYERSSPLVHFWLTKVAPSCVYPIRIDDEPLFFQCCICSAPIRRQAHMIRHYREQHHDQLPPNIFGPLDFFPCRLCRVQFTRHENLLSHLSSTRHIEALALNGSRTSSRRFEAINDAKLNARQVQDVDKRSRFRQEQEEWSRQTNTDYTFKSKKRPYYEIDEEDLVEEEDEDDEDDDDERNRTKSQVNEPTRKALRLEECESVTDEQLDAAKSNSSFVKSSASSAAKPIVIKTTTVTTTTTTATTSQNSDNNKDASNDIEELSSTLTRSASLIEKLAEQCSSSQSTTTSTSMPKTKSSSSVIHLSF